MLQATLRMLNGAGRCRPLRFRVAPAGRFDKALSAPALRTLFRIAELWGLSVGEQMTLLGIPSRSTFFKWKRTQDVTLSKDTLERMSYILGIYKALQVLLPDERAADAWIRKPNTAPPLEGDRHLSACSQVTSVISMWSGNISMHNAAAEHEHPGQSRHLAPLLAYHPEPFPPY
jgi:hypothetical protein